MFLNEAVTETLDANADRWMSTSDIYYDVKSRRQAELITNIGPDNVFNVLSDGLCGPVDHDISGMITYWRRRKPATVEPDLAEKVMQVLTEDAYMDWYTPSSIARQIYNWGTKPDHTDAVEKLLQTELRDKTEAQWSYGTLHYRARTPQTDTFKALDDYDWREAFEYADPEPHPWRREGTPPLDSFKREDVTTIFYMEEGENDGDDWIIAGQLRDGRYFFLSAGCDYTGWDCQAGGSCWVAWNLRDLVYESMSVKDRRRFGIIITSDSNTNDTDHYGM